MNKEKLKTNIKKEKLKKVFSQAPPKKSHIKQNKLHVKNTELTNSIIKFLYPHYFFFQNTD